MSAKMLKFAKSPKQSTANISDSSQFGYNGYYKAAEKVDDLETIQNVHHKNVHAVDAKNSFVNLTEEIDMEEDLEGISVSKYDHLPWGKLPGMLLEVNLRNFMCHEKYRFEPNQRLNFLTGENGSGKSAVLTAIVFGLGGTARTSNRGSSNKAFIRTGQSSAMVEIRLHNAGEKEYRPDLYGESIIVQRVVTNSSSTYKLKDHDGKIVVDKKVKEELDRILLNFNIQVENPIAVLNQDTAKTFLFACEPDKLYTFFMRATQLDQVKADYAVAAAETSAANALLNDKIESMPELKKEFNKWEKKYEYYQNLAEKKKDIDKRKAEVAWAVVRDGKVELEELNGNIDTEKKKIPVCDENIEKFTQPEKDAREKKKTIETEIQLMSKEVASTIN